MDLRRTRPTSLSPRERPRSVAAERPYANNLAPKASGSPESLSVSRALRRPLPLSGTAYGSRARAPSTPRGSPVYRTGAIMREAPPFPRNAGRTRGEAGKVGSVPRTVECCRQLTSSPFIRRPPQGSASTPHGLRAGHAPSLPASPPIVSDDSSTMPPRRCPGRPSF